MPFHLYFLRRLLFVIPTLLGITALAFIIANAIPADPVVANLPQSVLNNKEVVDAFRAKWGLDRPPIEQYFTYLGNLLQGDLGTSIRSRNPVAQDLAAFFPATFELATPATFELATYGIIFGILFGVGFGVISAIWRNSIIDYVLRTFSLIGVSFPVFLLALVGLSIFYVQLGWVGGPGRLSVRLPEPPMVTGWFTVDALLAGQWNVFSNAFSRIILPSLILASFVSGIIARITRSSLLNVLSMDYVRTARSKGLRERGAIWRHALPNAMIPVVTVIGLSYSNLLTGAVLTEQIFAWPGIGRYMFRASTSYDFPSAPPRLMIFLPLWAGVWSLPLSMSE